MIPIDHLTRVSSASIHVLAASEPLETDIRRTKEAGIKVFQLDGASILSQRDLLDTVSKVMHFPGYFRMNLNALVDCLGDLSWVPSSGYLLVLERASVFASNDSHLFRTFLEILARSSEEWARRHVTFHVLLVADYPFGLGQLDFLGDQVCDHTVPGR